MIKRSYRFAAILSVTALLLGTAATMAAEPSKPRDLNDFLCKDVMILSGLDRDLSISFVHGYMLGKNKTTQYEIDKLAKITDAFLDYCLDHPAEKALASFEKVYK
jgi:hypothetical protein